MSNTESRKQFEEWAKKRGLFLGPSFFRESCYADLGTQEAFEAWQASRAKPIVLPMPWIEEVEPDVLAMRTICKAAIEAAGYRCE